MVIGDMLLTIDVVLFLELWILSCVMIEPMYLYAPGNIRSGELTVIDVIVIFDDL